MNFELNGNRLREARRYRKLSISELAELVSVSKQMISRYERGNSQPGVEILQRIVRILKFPLDYLVSEDKVFLNDDGTFYRSRITATQSEKGVAETYKRAAALIRDYFSEYIDFPQMSSTNLSSDNPREAARELRKIWKLGNRPITNMMRLLENHGITVLVIDSGSKKIDGISGYFEIEGKSYYIILIDKISHSFYRQQFTLAHELGHKLLHADNINPQSIEDSDYRALEKEADRFASEFLLPAGSFVESLSNQGTNLKQYVGLKDHWNVSIASMIFRTRDLGIISPDEYTSLLKKISYRKWRTVEPLDESKDTPNPVLLKQALELLKRERILNPNMLSQELGDHYGVPVPNELLSEIIGIDPKILSGDIIQLNPITG